MRLRISFLSKYFVINPIASRIHYKNQIIKKYNIYDVNETDFNITGKFIGSIDDANAVEALANHPSWNIDKLDQHGWWYNTIQSLFRK